jgi:hypothetical protein
MKNASSLPVVCLLVAGLSGFAACKSTPPSDSTPPAPTAPTSTLSLFEHLAAEQAARSPATAPRAETVHAALAARGLVVERWKQVLATPVGARYCMAGSTDLGVGVAVCEYDGAQAASAGRDRSRAVFDRLIPGRELLVRGTTLLTLTTPGADRPADAAAAQTRRLADAVATL